MSLPSTARSIVFAASLALLLLCGQAALAQPAAPTQPTTRDTVLEYKVRFDVNGANNLDDVVAAVRQRVDADGKSHLACRPVPPDRIEIRVPPLRPEVIKAREEFELAIARFDATNLPWKSVELALAITDPKVRAATLRELSAGAPSSLKLMEELAPIYDKMQELKGLEKGARAAAATEPSQAEQAFRYGAIRAKMEIEQFEPLRQRLQRYDLPSDALLARMLLSRVRVEVAEESGKRDEAQRFQSEQSQATDMVLKILAEQGPPAREAAFLALTKTFDNQYRYRDDLVSSQVKRAMAGSGVLEFHILITSLDEGGARQMVARLEPGSDGPAPRAGDEMQWYPLVGPEHPYWPTRTWNDAKYVLLRITPEESMDRAKNAKPWGLKRAYATSDSRARPAVGFEFDDAGAKLFGELTASHINKPLAIVVDGSVLSAPNINSRIERVGIIDGGREGFTNAEVKALAAKLNAGALQAHVEFVAEHTLP